MPEAEGELLGPPMAINDVDLIVVPPPPRSTRRACDSAGDGGYFDKTLGSMGKCPPVYAVVFDHEVLESVPPREVHDQPVDGVVTPPTRIIAF